MKNYLSFLSNARLLTLALCMLTCAVCSAASKENTFTLFKKGAVAQIFVAADDEAPIRRAVSDLQSDIEMVTGVKPTVVSDLSQLTANSIIVGSVGNKTMQQLIATGKLAECESLQGKYESFVMKSVENLLPNSPASLVVVGSDALGAVYGMYEVSERIGVSPLYWWCDIAVERKKEVVMDNVLTLPQQPTIRYRGIFVNDEEALIQWSRLTSDDKMNGHISPEKYKKIFELILRLRANTLWPSMMEAGSFFFKYRDEQGVPINPKNATEYGLYIGSSHCENMARNNYDEWYDWAGEHKDQYDADGEPEWDYSVNPKAIEAYWQERLDECKDFNMIFTMGIRGVHDSPFIARKLKDQSLQSKVEMLQTVINRQREMIKNTFGAEDAVPQIFVPYEETGELYNGESKSGNEKCEGVKIPDDIIIVYTEDNYGYARQVPTERDVKRSGGLGIYYHFCYQGYPSHYDWLSTNPLTLAKEELGKIYDGGAHKFWIVNVGDIKPTELSLRYFMKYTNDVESYRDMPIQSYFAEQASAIFNSGEKQAAHFAQLLTDFQQFCSPQKPEFMLPFFAGTDWGTVKNDIYQYYSLFDFGDEAQRRIEQILRIEADARSMYNELSPEKQASFWHLAYYPIRSARLMLEKTTYHRKNKMYEMQGRFASVNGYKALSEKAEAQLQADLAYYNHELMNGKWNGITDPYATYNNSERILDIAAIPNRLAYSQSYLEEQGKGIGAVCEGQQLPTDKTVLRYSSFEDNIRFIDIFNKEMKSNKWRVEASSPLVKFSKKSGEVAVEERITATINWSKATAGDNKAEIRVIDEAGEVVNRFEVVATKYDFTPKAKSYVEGNGIVAIEAEHYTASKAGKGGATWGENVDYGYIGSTMFSRNTEKIASDRIEADSPVLEYEVYFETTGTFYGNLYRIPTLNEGKGKSCEVALGVNNNTPQLLAGVRIKGQRHNVVMSDKSSESYMWHRNVMAQMEKMPFKITIDKVGYNILKLYGVDTNIGVDRLVICTSKEAEQAHRRSLVSAPESYNTIVAPQRVTPATTPRFTAEQVAATQYPTLEPLLYAKFLFSHYAMPAMFGFTPVNQSNVYDANTTLYGWDKEDVKFVKSGHNESTRKYLFWNRDSNFSKKPATFYSRFMKGKYRVTLHYGNVMNYNNFTPGEDLQMTIKVNDKTVLDNEYVKESNPQSKTFDILVGQDQMMTFDFSGNWSISMVEIYRY